MQRSRGGPGGGPAPVWHIECDGVDDLWLEYRVADLIHLADDAQEVSFYAIRPEAPDLFANVSLAGSRLAAGAAPDTDGDGIHDACDACPNAPSSASARLPNGCPLAQDPCDP